MYYFDKGLVANNRNIGAQWNVVQNQRNTFDNFERHLAMMQGLAVNAAAIIPQDVFREFDNITKKIMRNDEGDVILNDLFPLAKALPVGKIEHQHRQASDSGNAITTISGQVPNSLDKAQYTFEKSIIPVHSDGFGRQWRELEGQRSEGFDGLIDDQENSVRAVRRKFVDYILDGDTGVVFNGTVWTGIRNDSRVAAVDLGGGGLNVDFTSSALTGAVARDKFIQVRDTLRITNNATMPVTFYVSREIMSNLERWYSDNDKGFGTILADLKNLNGVADIKESAKLIGNQIIGMVLNNQFIRPLTGMAVNTVPVVRQNPMDNHNFITWSAMGLEIKTDFDGRTGVLYASA
jgi:hypothetical protein